MANYTYCKQKIRELCMYIQCNEQIHKWYMIAHFWNTMKIAMRWNLKEHSRIVMLLQVAVTNWHVKSAGFIHKPSRELEPRYLSMIQILGAILNLVIFKLTNYLLLFLSNIDHISQVGKAKWHRMRQLKDQTPYNYISTVQNRVVNHLIYQFRLNCVFFKLEKESGSLDHTSQ